MKLFFKILLINTLFLTSCKEKNRNTNKIVSDTITKKEDVLLKNQSLENTATTTKEHYICYNADNNKNLKIWIRFHNNKAISVKYKGSKTAISLNYLKEEFLKGGAHPTIITHYNELYNGKINGQYILTHSGIWDYVKYIRGKDQKEFNFTIDHNSNNYSSKPCF
ncbi:hypothetical protein [Wenyingzhuangia aestuarii]|uniref:hypothetical protein n=1 Tax=Wenyingzhuangia aestuarii TaxID=1647582 RepID=UPI0014393E3E|nr:hypothetical protein [Wenyingzhuangia aestuarii]NJB83068.1 hypothetical protein [Wenyingzhuangia aestuarii]